jgi:stearoyl-CoA desaturase (delta-9 desaturase)
VNSWILGVILGLATTQLAVMATTIYLHRGLAHKSLTMDKRLALVFRLVIWITTGIRPREWVAVHRKHHAFTDEDPDPHSPWVLGFWKVQLGNVIYYRREANRRATVDKYAKDLVGDKLDEKLLDRSLLGLGIGIAILYLIGGWEVALVGSLVHVVSYLGISAAVNAIGHTYGKRPYRNLATNNNWLALISFGEGLHNNHHAAPTAARLSFGRREFDPAWAVIKVLVKTKLATVRHSKPVFSTKSGQPNAATEGATLA